MRTNKEDYTNSDHIPKPNVQNINKTQYSTFNSHINELSKKLYSAISIKLIKITQNDLGSEIKTVLSANQIKDALQNEISGLIDKYASEAMIIKNDCLNEITQHNVLINQYSQLKLNNSLDESKGILNALSDSIEKLLRDNKENIKIVLLSFKSLSTYTSNICDFIKKQKPNNALEKIELSERIQNELSNKIKDIKEKHNMFYTETKDIFKQLKNIFEEKRKYNKAKSPMRNDSNSKGNSMKAQTTPSLSPSSSSFMSNNHKGNNDKRPLNKANLSSSSYSKDSNVNHDQYLETNNKAIKTLTPNKSFHNTSYSISNKSKSPMPKIDQSALNDSIHQLKQKISELNKKNTEINSLISKEKTEKAFLLKEIAKLNAEIEKYKYNGFSLSNTFSDIIKGNQMQNRFSMREFNKQKMKIAKISQMTISFANSLSILQDSFIKKPSTSIELKMMFDNLKRTLIQIVNDISMVSKYMTNQSCLNSQKNEGQDKDKDKDDNINPKSKNEEIEELQNEIFDLKTQIALLNSKHIEDISKIQKEINDNNQAISIKHQYTFPFSSTITKQNITSNENDNNDEINQLKAELKRKDTYESALLKEIDNLKAKEANEINQYKLEQSDNENPNKNINTNTDKNNNINNQNALDTIKQKHNQNLDQLKKAYEESIETKEKSITYLNDINNQLKIQLEKIATEKTSLEGALSSNLIQYEIELSNIQNEKMRIEIQLEEAHSIELINQKKITELIEALNAKEIEKEKEEPLTALNQTNKTEREDDGLNQRLYEDNIKLNQKIIELTSLIESKDIIEQSINESSDILKERIMIFENKEREMELKLQEVTELYSKEKEKNDSLVIDKMLLMQKNDDLNNDIEKHSQRGNGDASLINLTVKSHQIYNVTSIEAFSFLSNDVVHSTIEKKRNWSKLDIANQMIQIEHCRDDSLNSISRVDKQLLNKQKEELSLLKSKLKSSLEQNDTLAQKLEEAESNFNSEKGEYIGMLRVAFEKLISEIQITNKSKEFATVIMRMLNYSDDDIFDIYNSGKKKTLFGFLK